MFFRKSLLPAALLSCLTLYGAVSLADENGARVVSIQMEPGSQNLVLQVENGAFDPVMHFEPRENGGFRIVIEGDNVEFDKDLTRDPDAMTEAFRRVMPDIKAVNLSQTSKGNHPGIKLVLDTDKKLQAHVRSNTGSLVTISLMGDAGTVVQRPAQPTYTASGPAVPHKSEGKPSLNPMPETAANASESATFSLYDAMMDPRTDGVVRQAWEDFRRGSLGTARLTLDSYLLKIPKDKAARYLLAHIHLALKDNASANGELQTLVKQDPKFIAAWVDLMNLSLATANLAEAERIIQMGTTQWPQLPEFYYGKGLLTEAKGDVEGARQAYMQALTKAHSPVLYHYRLAIIELKAGNNKAAELELQQVLRQSPDDSNALKALGYIYQKADKSADAAKYYKQALKPDVMINYASLLQQKNQTEDALALLRATEAIAQDNPEIQFNLGMLYADMKQKELAERTLNRFIGLIPEGKEDARVARAKSALKVLGATPAPRKTSESR